MTPMHTKSRLPRKCQEQNYKEETNTNIENDVHLNCKNKSSNRYNNDTSSTDTH